MALEGGSARSSDLGAICVTGGKRTTRSASGELAVSTAADDCPLGRIGRTPKIRPTGSEVPDVSGLDRGVLAGDGTAGVGSEGCFGAVAAGVSVGFGVAVPVVSGGFGAEAA
jgi:hypothetical protein